MLRGFAVLIALVAAAIPVSAQPPAVRVSAPAAPEAGARKIEPEMLLSPTSQLYLRWDGIAAHNEAYKNSIWGGVMAGPTGDSIRAVILKVQKLVGNDVLAEPLLEGKSPKELKANLTDLKHASKVIEFIAERGVVIGAEVREPRPTLKGVGSALGGLLGGKLPGPEAVMPDLHILAVVPDAGERSGTLNAAIRLAAQKFELKIEPFEVAGRKGFRMADGNPRFGLLQVAWWVEGKHFVLYLGTTKLDAMLTEIAANAAKRGVAAHPLYKRAMQNPGYESIARGFVDAARVVALAKGLGGMLVPGLSQRLDDLGFGNLKAVVFNSGFDGKESRATYDFDLPGERKGLARVLKQEPLTLKDLPPMPPDVSRFSALRIDPSAAYDAGIMALEALQYDSTFGPEEEAKSVAEKIRVRRDYIAKQYDKEVGINIKEDLVPLLGDKVVTFQSPTEGLSVFGTVVCVSLKDPSKIKDVADRIQRGMETLVGAPIKVRKKMLCGVEIRELYSRSFFLLTPAYAIVGDWLVVGLNPQCVQGFVLRAKGELPSWTPDAATAARLAKLPAGCGLQFCDPRSTVQNLCCIGPLALGVFGLRPNFGNETETDYDPLDVGLVPNGHELSKHLFPNLTVTRDDGKTVHIEVNESFSLPLEAIGFEPLAFASLFGLLAF